MYDKYRSSIPSDAVGTVISEAREENGRCFCMRIEYRVEGEIVGTRTYDPEGRLLIEMPMRNGKPHGTHYTWHDNGQLETVEPYEDGRIHGKARQYDWDGRLLGTYTLEHGTGFDVWRNVRENGTPFISEIHEMCDGRLHGIELWLREDESTAYSELFWRNGKQHGIQREWNSQNRIRRGYPKYWIRGEQVDKRKYLRACAHDETLPPFREKDQNPKRSLPPGIKP